MVNFISIIICYIRIGKFEKIDLIQGQFIVDISHVDSLLLVIN